MHSSEANDCSGQVRCRAPWPADPEIEWKQYKTLSDRIGSMKAQWGGRH
jgi:hypothetical protein